VKNKRNFRNRFFASAYASLSRTSTFQSMTDPWRKQLANEARGVVLEVGSGGGQNFDFYIPEITKRVEAIEPNPYMIAHARKQASQAKVDINLIQSSAESLPFEDGYFDTVLATLVFCSVDDPLQGLKEIRRVLRSGGMLLLLEHVRNDNQAWAIIQTMLTPIQKVIAGNCHLNRDTRSIVKSAGFIIRSEEWSGGGIHPQVCMVAIREDQ
jgi:ubiquinone/menaquinone biosynthesis C-methylase UbiE